MSDELDLDGKITPEEDRMLRQMERQTLSELIDSLTGRYERMNVSGQGVFGQYQSYVMLKVGSNQDFGYDVEKWRKWANENPDGFLLRRASKVQHWFWDLMPPITTFRWLEDTYPSQMAESEEARKCLIEDSGQDFGYEKLKWMEWYDENRPGEVWDFPRGYQPKKSVG